MDINSRLRIEKIVREMFPIGTKFIPLHVNNNYDNSFYCINTNNKFKWTDNNNLYILTDEGEMYIENAIKYGTCGYQRVVYGDNQKKYARIIEKGEQINKIYELWV